MRERKLPMRTLQIVVPALLIAGCSSVMMHTGAGDEYYPGTRADMSLLTGSENHFLLRTGALVDLPFSATLDTLLLPWDYFRVRRDQEKVSPYQRVLRNELETYPPPIKQK